MIGQVLGKTLFKLNGWTYQNDPSLWSDKQVVIGFPHTTNMDAIRSVALFHILGVQTHTLIKKELFKGVLKPILESLGAIPVDRQNAKDVVTQMAAEFAKRERFTLVLAPEATRAKDGSERKPIRTGFWHIAKAANVPIVLMISDNANQQGRFLGKIIPSELDADLKLIRELYLKEGVDVKIPDPQ